MVSRKHCPKCDSSQTYYKIKSKSFHCQSCGEDFLVEDKE